MYTWHIVRRITGHGSKSPWPLQAKLQFELRRALKEEESCPLGLGVELSPP